MRSSSLSLHATRICPRRGHVPRAAVSDQGLHLVLLGCILGLHLDVDCDASVH